MLKKEHASFKDKEFETTDDFAKRTGLPKDFIRALAKQGQIPTIKPKKRNIYICVSGAIAYLQQYAQMKAEEIAAHMPVPVILQPRRKKKSVGRRPDSVRLAGQKNQQEWST